MSETWSVICFVEFDVGDVVELLRESWPKY